MQNVRELWNFIEDFPDYEVSNLGRIRNMKTEQILKPTLNQDGVAIVGLVQAFNGGTIQRKRSVAKIVAKEWGVKRLMPTCDTPIRLNGDPMDNRVANLMMRPRWFAVKYNRQLKEGERYIYPIVTPIRDVETGRVYEDSLDAAKTHGLLEEDVVMSIANHTVTWPTYQKFELIEE